MLRVLYCILFFCFISPVIKGQNYLNIKSPAQLRSFFKYTGKDISLISGHRGTLIKGYPENSIEAFEYVLQHTPAFFEIDPRLTKDSVIVLLHDADLERTTTGKGKLSSYTWTELQSFFLKDVDGNITPYKIPRLADAIEWARGKTILNLDKKDVPPAMTAKLIKDLDAAAFVMVTVHTPEQAAYYYHQNPDQMMSAFVKTEEAMKGYEKAGVPWANMIAYIGSQHIPENKKMLDLLHARGVMCMVSAAPVYDKLPKATERMAAYKAIFQSGVDILESDIPVEASGAVMSVKSKKKSFFKQK